MKYRVSLSLLAIVTLGCSGGDHPMGAGEGGESASTGGQAGSNGMADGGSSGAGGSIDTTPDAGESGGGGSGGSTGGAGGVDAQGGTSAGGDAGAGGEAQIPTGESLFAMNCINCHGDEGAGTILAPEIQHPFPDLAVWMVRNGSDARAVTTYMSPMVPFDEAAVTPEQLNMIIEYLNALPKPTTGEALFLDYCANCHGADGKGGPTTRDLTGVDNLATEVPMNVREGHHPGEFGMRVEYMPAQDATRLTDDELGLIADYIATL